MSTSWGRFNTSWPVVLAIKMHKKHPPNSTQRRQKPCSHNHPVTHCNLPRGNSMAQNKHSVIQIVLWGLKWLHHRCPTYQLHLPPKTRFGDPKNHLQGDAGKFREIQGFLFKNIGMPRKRLIQGIPGNSFWGSQQGILGWCSWADEHGQSWYVEHGGWLHK